MMFVSVLQIPVADPEERHLFISSFFTSVIFFGTLPYNQIHLQNKYLFDASPGSAKITCENIAHAIYIRKYTLVPTLGFLKVYLSFEEKKKKLAGFKGVSIMKATFRRFLIHKCTAVDRSVYTAALRHSNMLWHASQNSGFYLKNKLWGLSISYSSFVSLWAYKQPALYPLCSMSSLHFQKVLINSQGMQQIPVI